MIQPVIAMPPHQSNQVNKLVGYCRRLDGTEVRVISTGQRDRSFRADFPNNRIASLQSLGLHIVSGEFIGQPFIWLEPDSIPLVPGWAHQLTKAYESAGKHFLLSSDQNPPFDLVGGIGVYGPYTHRLVPYQLREHGWDMFVYKHLKPLCAYTPLIQHSYGKYSPRGDVTYYEFPADRNMVRPDAVIFHKDAHQGLIKCSTSPMLP